MNYLAPPFESAWKGKHPFSMVSCLEGEVFREVKSRRTIRFKFDDSYYFAKIHFGIGWREILKDIVQLRLPIIGARNEWDAIKKLNDLDIDTMTPVAFGLEGVNPAQKKSFIITEELKDTIPLEDHCKTWTIAKPSFKAKIGLIKKVAEISRKMHGAGMCHRDYYLCHFHLRRDTEESEPRLSLIDLHRALISKNLATRWIIKDIAGLYFSAMDIGLTERDKYRFIQFYTGLPLAKSFSQSEKFWLAVFNRAMKLYEKESRKSGKEAKS